MTDMKSDIEKNISAEDFQTCIDTLAVIADRLVGSEDGLQKHRGIFPLRRAAT
ncbi:MAG: hypothetical protein ACP5FL_01355 [Thermoplasmatota archaeon]